MTDNIFLYKGYQVRIVKSKFFTRADGIKEGVFCIQRADVMNYDPTRTPEYISSMGIISTYYAPLTLGLSAPLALALRFNDREFEQMSELSMPAFERGVNGYLSDVSSWELYTLNGNRLQDLIQEA